MEAASVTASSIIRVAALSGSLRKSSYNRGLIRSAIEISKTSINGLQIEYIDISPLPLLNTDLEGEGSFPPAVEAFRQKILEADSILFASPEYNYSLSDDTPTHYFVLMATTCVLIPGVGHEI
ncbi:NADPH:quinone oxidoreductase isoform X1 [Prunus yedoensis var. nudiflora]|uniref:NAD(P)H dehydrogenase (quinone) n=1 Tax=Prunus yedoensis var. nudiflora TaxID=2094558 RepID=A0A314ZDL6_PRUYE|nr:NADPH:quinone oxidoreductase isoform X1 [Prunus yedoensis var. nudiflora]